MSNEIMEKKNYQIAVLSGGCAGLTAEEIAEEMGGDLPEYPRVKVPAGGAVAFEMPGDDPSNPEYVKEITGVIVWHHKSNAYWDRDAEDDAPPVCVSLDGINGAGIPGGYCDICPCNQFGSGEGGRGKACKNMYRLYILTEDSLLPLVLTLPPTSLSAWKSYRTLLITKGLKACSVVTKITLNRKESNGNAYAVAAFRNAGDLSEGMKHAAEMYRKDTRAIIEAGYDVLPNQRVDVETGEIQ